MEGVLQAVVGANIRRVRLLQGLSQESFGEAVGWHRTLVGSVERGERNLTMKSVERISDRLGVHPLDLLWDRASVGLRVDADGSVCLADFDAAPVLRAADGAVGAAGQLPPPSGQKSRRSQPN